MRFEEQLENAQSPGMGVGLPSRPGVVIGFMGASASVVEAVRLPSRLGVVIGFMGASVVEAVKS
jgi:hypothetical protein